MTATDDPQQRFIIAPDDPGLDAMNDMLEVKVLKVFDGDGFLADVWHPLRAKWVNRIPFRFAFIDAPEMGQPFGVEAKDFLHRLIAEKTLMLDPIGKESAGYMPVDPYRRMLCMAYLTIELHAGEIRYFQNGGTHGGTVKRPRSITRNIELEMISNGMAWVVEQYAFVREDEYFAAQGDARRERRGLWALDDPEPPWTFKRRQKARRKATDGQLSLFVQRCEAEGCNGHLVERTGVNGPFYGCSNFPRCRFNRSG